MNNLPEEDFILIWEAPKIEKPEFRLYYDEQGKVLFYTCEKVEGNYIVVDAQTFAESRPDIRVIDGRISTVNPAFIVTKLMPDNKEGTVCAYEDISIVITKPTKVKTQKWKLRTYELR
jgi:hypothetical protein